jgi:hypothetical protein
MQFCYLRITTVSFITPHLCWRVLIVWDIFRRRCGSGTAIFRRFIMILRRWRTFNSECYFGPAFRSNDLSGGCNFGTACRARSGSPVAPFEAGPNLITDFFTPMYLYSVCRYHRCPPLALEDPWDWVMASGRFVQSRTCINHLAPGESVLYKVPFRRLLRCLFCTWRPQDPWRCVLFDLSTRASRFESGQLVRGLWGSVTQTKMSGYDSLEVHTFKDLSKLTSLGVSLDD